MKAANGVIANGHAKTSRPVQPSRPRRQKNYFGSLMSIAVRLFLWYTAVTTLFFCPSTVEELKPDSARICRPYLNLKSQATPYVQPYYDTYLGPYVQRAQPYYESFHKQIYTPTAEFAKHSYSTYGSPRLAQAQVYSQEQWEKTVRPQLDTTRQRAFQQYEATLKPHVDKAWSAASPYYSNAKDSAEEIYETTLLPAYSWGKPYAETAYKYGNRFAVEVGIPYTQKAGQTLYAFLSRTVWPRLRILYGENVEPQLMRITERLGRYKDSKKLEAEFEEVDTSSEVSSTSSTVSSLSSSVATAATQITETSVESEPSSTPPPAADSELSEEQVRQKIENDLQRWQEKFSKAAKRGTEDLHERIQEISDKQKDQQAKGVGSALIIELEETGTNSIKTLKETVQNIVDKMPEDETDGDVSKANQVLVDAVIAAGKPIKKKAEDIRTWKQKYDRETVSLAEAASNSTMEVIDRIRDLGLQEIGQRWAWMDGVTYKDWSRYHSLSQTFDEWRGEISAMISKHQGLVQALEEGADIEAQAMSITEEAANELARLKGVAARKLRVKDSSDDFSDHVAAEAFENASQAVKEKVMDASAAVLGESQETEQPLASTASGTAEETASSLSDTLSDASETLVGTSLENEAPMMSTVSSRIDDTESSLSSTASEASESAFGNSQGSAESFASSVGSVADELASSVSETMSSTAESVVKSSSSIPADAASKFQEAITASKQGPTPEGITASSKVQDLPPNWDKMGPNVRKKWESVKNRGEEMRKSKAAEKDSAVSEASDSVVSVASAASETPASEISESAQKVMGGAMAQSVSGDGQPILDDIIDEGASYSEKLQSILSGVGDQATDLTKAISEAMLSATSTQGTVESVTSLASEQYLKALSAASSALYGPEKGAAEEFGSAASDRYAQAVTAASNAIYGTPTPLPVSLADQVSSAVYGTSQGPLESISSIASSRLAEGLSAASAQYSSAIGATPTPAHQQYLDSAQKQYYQGIGLAHERYSEFLSAAQSQYSVAMGAAANSRSQLGEAVESQYSAAMTVAAEMSSSASSAVYGTSTGAAESFGSAASESIMGAAAEASASASSAIYGTTTGAVESLSSQASQNWESLVSAASSAVYGKPTPWSESVLAQGSEYAAQATDAVAAQYASVQAIVSELVVGKEPDFTESVMSRLYSAYSTGAPQMASSVSSFVEDTYASASSAISAAFTPPAAVEEILALASKQFDDAFSAGSAQVYGSSSQGTLDSITSAASSMASEAAASASEAVYGTQKNYAEQAQESIVAVASDAQRAISEAIYGTETGAMESATSAASAAYSSAMSSASVRLTEAVESARVRAGGLGASVQSAVEDAASSVSSVASAATAKVKDEL
ncbi:MAG: hypothetical protein Q9157_006511 [Trypethelium eluteriae]